MEISSPATALRKHRFVLSSHHNHFGVAVLIMQFVAATQISRVNCDEMDDKTTCEQELLCCRASHELCSNYLLSLFWFTCKLPLLAS